MKRPLVLGAAWTASAAAAVGLGFLAVSLVDASASPRAGTAAAATTAATGTATPTSAAPAATSGEYVTVGGTVFASCAGGVASLAGAPAPGWRVDDSAEPGEVEFRNGTQKIEVHAVCVGDAPQFSDEGLRDSTSGGDESSGHGSDDSGGDDSSGRGGGGHGSDG